jgi:hypothetical protein
VAERQWKMICKSTDDTGRGHLWDIITAFVGRNWENLWKITVKRAGRCLGKNSNPRRADYEVEALNFLLKFSYFCRNFTETIEDPWANLSELGGMTFSLSLFLSFSLSLSLFLFLSLSLLHTHTHTHSTCRFLATWLIIIFTGPHYVSVQCK